MSTGQADPRDVESIDAVVKALYACVCFPPGGKPDHDRLRALFLPRGRLVPPSDDPDNAPPALDLDGFIELSERAMKDREFGERGFHESEIARRSETFGCVTHVLSTYEARYSASDPEALGRGINSIQLVRHGGRFWVVCLAWDDERPETPIPDRYLSRAPNG